jgi:hypothetical protein
LEEYNEAAPVVTTSKQSIRLQSLHFEGTEQRGNAQDEAASGYSGIEVV